MKNNLKESKIIIEQKAKLKKFILIALFVVISQAILFIIFQCYPISNGSPKVFISYCMLWYSIFPFLILSISSILGAIYIPIALIVSIFIRNVWRIRLLTFCIIFAITIGITVSTIIPIKYIRLNAFKTVAKRGEVIIQAIENYKKENGKYPKKLFELIPKYIDKIPGTGIRAYPEFEYRGPILYYNNLKAAYELRVNCPSGGINFDCFIYWPNQNYPDTIYSGVTKRIGKWAYVYE